MNINEWFSPGGPVQNIFLYALGIGAIIALGVIIFGAIKHVTSGDSESKQKEARAWIFAAVKGLAVLAGGFVILSIANPGLLVINTAPLDLVTDILAVPPPVDSAFISGVDPVTGEAIFDRNKVQIEGNKIIIKELPEGMTVSSAISELKARVKDNNIQGVESITDESTGENIQIVITTQSGFDSTDVANKLLAPQQTGSIGGGSTSGKMVYIAPVQSLFQTDRRWVNKEIGPVPNCPSQHTYGRRGCGPTSLAMVVLYLTGNKYVTADNAVTTMGAKIVERGYKRCAGSEPSGVYKSAFTAKGIPANFGLTSYNVNNQAGAKKCFSEGGIMVGSMVKSNDDKNDVTWHPKFTDYAHYIVVKGIDENKNLFYINDPNGGRVKSSEIAHFFKRSNVRWCIKRK
ncbi:MAG: C39 family peptidase [Parcubacteria group bacterium]